VAANPVPPRLALVGAGAIGRRHAALVASGPDAILSAVVDPTAAGEILASEHGVPWHRSLADLIARDRPDGLIIATPNQHHVAGGLEAVAAGLPALVEKPLADELAGARRLVEAAEAAGVPLLVGHHRRHNPMLAAAREAIAAGRIGQVLAVHAQCWFRKPDAYFEPAWRRAPGAGPVLTNLVHDVDNLRWLCGEVVSVQAIARNTGRGHAVEDTAAVLLGFASGAVGTMTLSDAIVSPWSWELTAGENPDYPQQRDAFCYLVGGTEGSLSIPALELSRNGPVRDWHQPILRERLDFVPADPLAAQIAHFAGVIRGGAAPLVSGREGLRSLAVLDAVKRSSLTGAQVAPDASTTGSTRDAAS
jgi:predicted dehydrogenase